MSPEELRHPVCYIIHCLSCLYHITGCCKTQVWPLGHAGCLLCIGASIGDGAWAGERAESTDGVKKELRGGIYTPK